MRPLARWTIGKAQPAGEEILRVAVKRFRRIYPEFDLIVCYNNLTPEQEDRLGLLNVPLHRQTEEESAHPLISVDAPPGRKNSSPGWGWKLVPPRLRIEGHELWIDNDILLRERLPTIDQWLQSDCTLISTGLHKAYGIFHDGIKDPIPYCAGFFGLPPGLDFGERIARYCQQIHGPLGYYDEQGVTTSVVLERQHFAIPYSDLMFIKKAQRPYAKGLHFVGANRHIDYHVWDHYKCSIMMP